MIVIAFKQSCNLQSFCNFKFNFKNFDTDCMAVLFNPFIHNVVLEQPFYKPRCSHLISRQPIIFNFTKLYKAQTSS